MPDATAGQNIAVDIAQLSGDLLGTQIVVQINDPLANDEVYLVGYPRWGFEIIDVYTKCVNGTADFRITIQDAAPVEFDPATTNAVVQTDGDMESLEGDWEGYTANGGDTGGSGSNVITAGQQVKIVFTDVTANTGGMSFVADVHVRRTRSE